MVLKVSYRGSCDMTEFNLDSIGQSDPGSYRSRKITEWSRPSEGIHLVEGVPTFTSISDQENQRACYMLSELRYLATEWQTGKHARDKHAFTWHRHFGATNVLFMDGHVDRLPPMDVGTVAMKQEVRQGTVRWRR